VQNYENPQTDTAPTARKDSDATDRVPNSGAPEIEPAGPSSTDEKTDDEYASILGKMVVDSNGSLLGSTKGVALDESSDQKLAIVSVSNVDGIAGNAKEVVVPVTEFSKDVVPEKLILAMTWDELVGQPEASGDNYKELARAKSNLDQGIEPESAKPTTIAEPDLSAQEATTAEL
jgi:sporulation protein YlmC with PRC-barrel domain